MRFNSAVYAVIAILALFVSLNCSADRGPEKTKAGGTVEAPDFNLVTLDGKPVNLGSYKGKALILNVWDTWCPPCRAEIPDFIELYSEYRSKGLEILGIAAGSRGGETAVRSFISQNGINYPNAMLNEDFLMGYQGIRSIPTTFVIDKEGKIYQKYIGARSKAVFESDIKALLAL